MSLLDLITCMYNIDVFMFHAAGSYEIIQKNTICNALTLNEINSEDECEIAAQKLGLQFGERLDRIDDFPSCFAELDIVFFNINKNPKRENLSEEYAAICKGK